MPGKKALTEKSYHYTPLRKPGEGREAPPSESGGRDEQLPSCAKESDEDGKRSDVTGMYHVI